MDLRPSFLQRDVGGGGGYFSNLCSTVRINGGTFVLQFSAQEISSGVKPLKKKNIQKGKSRDQSHQIPLFLCVLLQSLTANLPTIVICNTQLTRATGLKHNYEPFNLEGPWIFAYIYYLSKSTTVKPLPTFGS
jgi:hypothetical protein